MPYETEQGTAYEVWLADSEGYRVGGPIVFEQLQYSRARHTVTKATLQVRLDRLDDRLVRKDSILYVYREPAGMSTHLDTGTVWFVRSMSIDESAGLLTLEAQSANYILTGRGVMASTGSPEAGKSGPADDLMRAYVREALTDQASNPARSLGWRVQVEADQGLGPLVDGAGAWLPLTSVLNTLAEDAAKQGVALDYDVVVIQTQPLILKFLVFAGQRGIDRRYPGAPRPMRFGLAYGNLEDVTVSQNWADEITVAVMTGSGLGAEREYSLVQDADRVGASPWSWREEIAVASADDESGRQTEGRALLQRQRGKITVEGKIAQTSRNRYGVDWNWGDRVTVEERHRLFDAQIAMVRVGVRNGEETVEAWLRGEGDL